MSEAKHAEESEPKGVFDRIVICFRWSWCWKGFWSGWVDATKGVFVLAWMAIIGFIPLIVRVVIVSFYPFWRLLIEPLWVAIKINNKDAAAIKSVLDGQHHH